MRCQESRNSLAVLWPDNAQESRRGSRGMARVPSTPASRATWVHARDARADFDEGFGNICQNLMKRCGDMLSIHEDG